MTTPPKERNFIPIAQGGIDIRKGWHLDSENRWQHESGIEIHGNQARLSPLTGRGPRTATAEQDGGIRLRGRRGTLAFESLLRVLELPSGEEALELSGEVTNHGIEPVRLDRLRHRYEAIVLPGNPSVRDRQFFKNGFQSWSETRSYRGVETEMRPWLPTMVELQDNPWNLPPHRGGRRRGKFRSDFFGIVGATPDEAKAVGAEVAGKGVGEFLLVGQAEGFNQLLYIRSRLNRIRRPPYLEVIHDFGGQELPPHAATRLDPVLFIVGESGEKLQAKFFDEIRRRLLRRKQEWSLPGRERPQTVDARRLLDFSRTEPVTGWGSWYYYYTGVTEAAMERNLRILKRRFPGLGYVVLDDGYQRNLGDWLIPNDDFPRGLGDLAARISEHGFEPGIWLAPFVAGRGSSIYREHRDWFIRNPRPVRASWNPHWGRDSLFYALDTTHPEVQSYLRLVVRTLTREYGFRFLKLDFLYAATFRGNCYDNRYAPAERLKLGYDIIREEAGPNVFLLGCGSPLAQAIGRVEAMRIGPDVAPFWFDSFRYHVTRDPHAASTLFAVRSAINRAPMHRRLWLNDPDCLLLREKEILMNPVERMTLAFAAILTGSTFFLSDKLDLISDTGRRTVEKLLEISERCGAGYVIPLEIMSQATPRILLNSAGYVGAFNLTDNRSELTLPIDRIRTAKFDGRNGATPRALREILSGEELPFPRALDGPSGEALRLGSFAPHESGVYELLWHD